jgi:hypothetical protein
MKKLTCVVAILAAASTAAVAKDLKQGKKAPAPTVAVAATQMTDAEMDNVTAGFVQVGVGVGTATGQTPNALNAFNGISRADSHTTFPVGAGRCTAGFTNFCN